MIISCIIPYFNEEENIIYTLNQLLNQTYKSKEIIFINSNSYDNSPKIVKNFISNVDLNIKNFDTNIQSASEAKNFGIEKSNFEWLAFMDCDMSFDEFWLEKQVTFANRFPNKSRNSKLLPGIIKCNISNIVAKRNRYKYKFFNLYKFLYVNKPTNERKKNKYKWLDEIIKSGVIRGCNLQSLYKKHPNKLPG